MASIENQSIVMAGASGLVGSALLAQLTQDKSIAHICNIARRSSGTSHARYSEIITSDLLSTKLDVDQFMYPPKFGFICLGTTAKQAGSKAGLKAVDLDMVVHLANEYKKIGVTHLCVVSSFGANATSPSHYLRCKGEMEKALIALEFGSLIFMHPGPLVGQRAVERSDEIWVQRLLRLFNPLMRGYLANFKPIEASDVAKAMWQATLYADLTLDQSERQENKGASKVRYLTSPDMLVLNAQ